MIIRTTSEADWPALKTVRLAALLDAPTAFGVRHASAAAYTDDDWRRRASGATGTAFWLAWHGDVAVGLAGGAVGGDGRYNLIAMWVAPAARGTGIAGRLVAAAKAHAVAGGHARIVLDVAPENARAAAFYRAQGFVFIDEWEPLESHPEIRLRKMVWTAANPLDPSVRAPLS